MIPDIYWSVIQLGPLPLQVWGLFVATGMGVAIYIAKRYAEQRQLDGKVVGINQPFVAAGSVIDSDDAAQPLQIAHNIHHPPLIRSCSCRIDPVLPAPGGSS